MNNKPADTLVINLKMLMFKLNISSAQLAEKSGVSKRMIDYILSGERKASVEVAGEIASGLGLTAWQLIMPSLSYDIAKDGTLEKLVNNFAHCSNTSQDFIFQVAAREAKFEVNGQ